LEGATIALVENGKPRADDLLRAIASELQARVPSLSVIGPIRTDHLMEASRAQVDDIAARADLVINALGDCGACSAFTALVATEFELRGIPAVAVFTEPFVLTARELAARRGVADLQFAVLAHPIASLPTDELLERAAAAVPQILAILEGRVSPRGRMAAVSA
jgi:hypothetical protein